MKKNLLTGLVTGLFLVGMVGLAQANLIEIGEAFDSGSWTQRFGEYDVGGYNKFEAFMLSSGDAFMPTGFENFSEVGWAGSLVRSDYITATGPNQTSMEFDIHFDGLQNDPLEFVFLAWEDSLLREKALLKWDFINDVAGWNWVIVEYVGDVDSLDRSAPIPEPATMLLFGTGLAGLVGNRIRKKK